MTRERICRLILWTLYIVFLPMAFKSLIFVFSGGAN